MRNVINSVAEEFLQSELGKEVIGDFLRLKADPGWKFLQVFSLELGNHIANRVLSRAFQKMEDREKLVQLAAYSKVSDLLKFYANPIPTIENAAKVKRHNQQMGLSVREARKQKQAELTERSLRDGRRNQT